MVEFCLIATERSFKHVQCILEDCFIIRSKRLIEHYKTGETAEPFDLTLLSEILQFLGRNFIILNDFKKFILNLRALFCLLF